RALLDKICSIFRAMLIWEGLQLSAVIDRPSDTTYIYTNANVVGGKFSYSSSSKKARRTAVQVKWLDPTNGWETAIEYTADDSLINRFGYNVANIEAFGCTSRGQARRTGRWIIETEKLETQTVAFSVGREGLRHLPGDIIGIADNDYTQDRIGGRIKEVNGNLITLDRDVEIKNASTASFWVVDHKGKTKKLSIQAIAAPNKIRVIETVTLNKLSVWALATDIAKLRLFK